VAVTREQIAAALSTVPGVTGEALEPPTKGAGQAWPIWRDTVTLNGCDAVTVNWYVYVVMPGGDMNAPPEAVDPIALPISRALRDTGLTVERWEPYQLINWQQPDSAIPVLRFSAFD
jgi:hypothetical protein